MSTLERLQVLAERERRKDPVIASEGFAKESDGQRILRGTPQDRRKSSLFDIQQKSGTEGKPAIINLDEQLNERSINISGDQPKSITEISSLRAQTPEPTLMDRVRSTKEKLQTKFGKISFRPAPQAAPQAMSSYEILDSSGNLVAKVDATGNVSPVEVRNEPVIYDAQGRPIRAKDAVDVHSKQFSLQTTPSNTGALVTTATQSDIIEQARIAEIGRKISSGADVLPEEIKILQDWANNNADSVGSIRGNDVDNALLIENRVMDNKSRAQRLTNQLEVTSATNTATAEQEVNRLINNEEFVDRATRTMPGDQIHLQKIFDRIDKQNANTKSVPIETKTAGDFIDTNTNINKRAAALSQDMILRDIRKNSEINLQKRLRLSKGFDKTELNNAFFKEEARINSLIDSNTIPSDRKLALEDDLRILTRNRREHLNTLKPGFMERQDALIDSQFKSIIRDTGLMTFTGNMGEGVTGLDPVNEAMKQQLGPQAWNMDGDFVKIKENLSAAIFGEEHKFNRELTEALVDRQLRQTIVSSKGESLGLSDHMRSNIIDMDKYVGMGLGEEFLNEAKAKNLHQTDINVSRMVGFMELMDPAGNKLGGKEIDRLKKGGLQKIFQKIQKGEIFSQKAIRGKTVPIIPKDAQSILQNMADMDLGSQVNAARLLENEGKLTSLAAKKGGGVVNQSTLEVAAQELESGRAIGVDDIGEEGIQLDKVRLNAAELADLQNAMEGVSIDGDFDQKSSSQRKISTLSNALDTETSSEQVRRIIRNRQTEFAADRISEKAEFKRLANLGNAATQEEVMRLSDLLQIHDQRVELGRNNRVVDGTPLDFAEEDVTRAREQIQKLAKQKVSTASNKVGQELAGQADSDKAIEKSKAQVDEIEKASPVEQADVIRSTNREAQAKVQQVSLDEGEDLVQQTIEEVEDVDDSWKQTKQEHLSDPDKAKSASRLQDLGEKYRNIIEYAKDSKGWRTTRSLSKNVWASGFGIIPVGGAVKDLTGEAYETIKERIRAFKLAKKQKHPDGKSAQNLEETEKTRKISSELRVNTGGLFGADRGDPNLADSIAKTKLSNLPGENMTAFEQELSDKMTGKVRVKNPENGKTIETYYDKKLTPKTTFGDVGMISKVEDSLKPATSAFSDRGARPFTSKSFYKKVASLGQSKEGAAVTERMINLGKEITTRKPTISPQSIFSRPEFQRQLSEAQDVGSHIGVPEEFSKITKFQGQETAVLDIDKAAQELMNETRVIDIQNVDGSIQTLSQQEFEKFKQNEFDAIDERVKNEHLSTGSSKQENIISKAEIEKEKFLDRIVKNSDGSIGRSVITKTEATDRIKNIQKMAVADNLARKSKLVNRATNLGMGRFGMAGSIGINVGAIMLAQTEPGMKMSDSVANMMGISERFGVKKNGQWLTQQGEPLRQQQNALNLQKNKAMGKSKQEGDSLATAKQRENIKAKRHRRDLENDPTTPSDMVTSLADHTRMMQEADLDPKDWNPMAKPAIFKSRDAAANLAARYGGKVESISNSREGRALLRQHGEGFSMDTIDALEGTIFEDYTGATILGSTAGIGLETGLMTTVAALGSKSTGARATLGGAARIGIRRGFMPAVIAETGIAAGEYALENYSGLESYLLAGSAYTLGGAGAGGMAGGPLGAVVGGALGLGAFGARVTLGDYINFDPDQINDTNYKMDKQQLQERQKEIIATAQQKANEIRELMDQIMMSNVYSQKKMINSDFTSDKAFETFYQRAEKEKMQRQLAEKSALIREAYILAEQMDKRILGNKEMRQEGEVNENWFSDDDPLFHHNYTADAVSRIMAETTALYDPSLFMDLKTMRRMQTEGRTQNQILEAMKSADLEVTEFTSDGKEVTSLPNSEEVVEMRKAKSKQYLKGLLRINEFNRQQGLMQSSTDFASADTVEDALKIGDMSLQEFKEESVTFNPKKDQSSRLLKDRRSKLFYRDGQKLGTYEKWMDAVKRGSLDYGRVSYPLEMAKILGIGVMDGNMVTDRESIEGDLKNAYYQYADHGTISKKPAHATDRLLKDMGVLSTADKAAGDGESKINKWILGKQTDGWNVQFDDATGSIMMDHEKFGLVSFPRAVDPDNPASFEKLYDKYMMDIMNSKYEDATKMNNKRGYDPELTYGLSDTDPRKEFSKDDYSQYRKPNAKSKFKTFEEFDEIIPEEQRVMMTAMSALLKRGEDINNTKRYSEKSEIDEFTQAFADMKSDHSLYGEFQKAILERNVGINTSRTMIGQAGFDLQKGLGDLTSVQSVNTDFKIGGQDGGMNFNLGELSQENIQSYVQRFQGAIAKKQSDYLDTKRKVTERESEISLIDKKINSGVNTKEKSELMEKRKKSVKALEEAKLKRGNLKAFLDAPMTVQKGLSMKNQSEQNFKETINRLSKKMNIDQASSLDSKVVQLQTHFERNPALAAKDSWMAREKAIAANVAKNRRLAKARRQQKLKDGTMSNALTSDDLSAAQSIINNRSQQLDKYNRRMAGKDSSNLFGKDINREKGLRQEIEDWADNNGQYSTGTAGNLKYSTKTSDLENQLSFMKRLRQESIEKLTSKNADAQTIQNETTSWDRDIKSKFEEFQKSKAQDILNHRSLNPVVTRSDVENQKSFENIKGRIGNWDEVIAAGNQNNNFDDLYKRKQEAFRNFELVGGLPEMIKHTATMSAAMRKDQGMVLEEDNLVGAIPYEDIERQKQELDNQLMTAGLSIDWWRQKTVDERPSAWNKLLLQNASMQETSKLSEVGGARIQGSFGGGIVDEVKGKTRAQQDFSNIVDEEGKVVTPATKLASNTLMKSIKRDFDLFDVNKDGKLTADEISLMGAAFDPRKHHSTRLSGIENPYNELQREIAGTRAGTITPEVFEKLMAFDQATAGGNADGTLDRAEVFKDQTKKEEEVKVKDKVKDFLNQKFIKQVSPYGSTLKEGLRSYFSGSPEGGMRAVSIWKELSEQDKASLPEHLQFDYNIAKQQASSMINALPYHRAIVKKGKVLEEESKQKYGDLYEIMERRRLDPRELEQAKQLEFEVAEKKKKGETNTKDFHQKNTLLESYLTRHNDVQNIQKELNSSFTKDGLVEGRAFSLPNFLVQQGMLTPSDIKKDPNWAPATIHDQWKNYGNYFKGSEQAAAAINSVEAAVINSEINKDTEQPFNPILNKAVAEAEEQKIIEERDNFIKNFTDKRAQKVFEEERLMDLTGKRDSNLLDPTQNVKLQKDAWLAKEQQQQINRKEGLKKMVANAAARKAQRQAFTDIRDPLQFIQQYSSNYNERKGELWRNVDFNKNQYEQRKNDGATAAERQNALEIYQKSLNEELEHRRIVNPGATIEDVINRSMYEDIKNTDWAFGGTYKDFFKRYDDRKLMFKSPEGVDIPIAEDKGPEEAGKMLWRFRQKEMIPFLKSNDLITDDLEFVSKVNNSPISEKAIYELMAQTAPGNKYIYKPGDKFTRFQEIWSKKFGGNFTKGAMGLFDNTAAKFILDTSGQFGDLGDTSSASEQGGVFEVQRVAEDIAEGVKENKEPEVVGRFNVLNPDQKLMMSIAESAKNGFKDSGGMTDFRSIYRGMSLSARESFKRKYKDKIEQTVPPSIVKQLNQFISGVDKVDLYGVANGEMVPKYLRNKVDKRVPLSKRERDEMAEYKRREMEARRIVTQKRRQSGISATAGYLIDKHELDEPLARFIAASPGVGPFRALSNIDKLIKETESADISMVNRKVGGTWLKTEEDRERKLANLQRSRAGYFNSFRSSIERDPRASKNIVFDQVHPRGFRSHPDMANITNNIVRRPVVSELSEEERKAAARLNINIDDEFIRTDANGVPLVKEESRNGVKRFEGTGPFDILTKTNKLDGIHETFDLDVVQQAAAQAARSMRIAKQKEIDAVESMVQYDPKWDQDKDGKLSPEELERKKTMEEIVKRNQQTDVKPKGSSAKGFAPPRKSSPLQPKVSKGPKFTAKASLHQAYSEIKDSVLANYKRPVTPDQVGIANLRTGTGRFEKRVVNAQEKIFNYGGLDFVAPPKNTSIARKYASEVEDEFGFDPYDRDNIKNAAQGFIPNRGQSAKAEQNPTPGINKATVAIDSLTKVLNTKMFQTKEVKADPEDREVIENSRIRDREDKEQISESSDFSKETTQALDKFSTNLDNKLEKLILEKNVQDRFEKDFASDSSTNTSASISALQGRDDMEKDTFNKAPVNQEANLRQAHIIQGLSKTMSDMKTELNQSKEITVKATDVDKMNQQTVLQDTVTSDSVAELFTKIAKEFLTQQSERFNDKGDNRPTGEIMEATLNPLVEIFKSVVSAIEQSMVDEEKKSKLEEEKQSKRRGDERKELTKIKVSENQAVDEQERNRNKSFGIEALQQRKSEDKQDAPATPEPKVQIEYVEPNLPKLEGMVTAINNKKDSLETLENKDLTQQLAEPASSSDEAQSKVRDAYAASRLTDTSSQTGVTEDIKRFFDSEALSSNETQEPMTGQEALTQDSSNTDFVGFLDGLIKAFESFITRLSEVEISAQETVDVTPTETAVKEESEKPKIDVDSRDFKEQAESARQMSEEYSEGERNTFADQEQMAPPIDLETPTTLGQAVDPATEVMPEPTNLPEEGFDSQSNQLLAQLPEGIEEALTIKLPNEMPNLALDFSAFDASIERLREVLVGLTEIKISAPAAEELRLSLPENAEDVLTLRMPSDEETKFSVDSSALQTAIEDFSEAITTAAEITHTHETKIDASGNIVVTADSSSVQAAIAPQMTALRNTILGEAERIISSKIAMAMNEINKLR